MFIYNPNMKNFFQKLPLDIVLRIIPYTYNVQNKNLLDDIVNYKESKTTLFELYHNNWIWITGYTENHEEDKNWLINDIFAYANNYEATMYGYIPKFYNIFKRNTLLQSEEDIDTYVYNLEKKEVSTQINIFLGLLTPNERIGIITKKIYS